VPVTDVPLASAPVYDVNNPLSASNVDGYNGLVSTGGSAYGYLDPNAFSGSPSDSSSEFASLYGLSPSAPSIESLYGTGFGEVPVTVPMEPLGVHTDAPMSVNAHIVPTALETSEGLASFFQWAQREAGMPGLHAYAAADPRPEALADIETPWYYFQPGWAEQQQATAAMEASNPGNTLVQRGVFTLLAAAEWPLSVGEAGTRTMLNVPANINMTTQWLTAASLTNDSDNRLTYISNGLGSFGETLFGMAGIGGLAESAASDTLLGSNLGISRQGVTLSGNAGNYTLRSPIYFDLAPGRLNSGVPLEFQNPLVPSTTSVNATPEVGVGSSAIPPVLYHYTNDAGMNGILESEVLNPSLKELNPNDVRYGNGQYLSDIAPGTMTPAQLSRAFINNPFQGARYTNFIEIDTAGLNIIQGRPGVYVVPNEVPLDLSGRITNSGQVLGQ